MNRSTATFILALLGTFDFGFLVADAATVEADVAKKLDNGQALPDDKITRIKVSYDCSEGGDSVKIGEITVGPPSSLRKSDVTLYFANEVKNILRVTVTDHDFSGMYYDVPHDSSPTRKSDSSNNFRTNGLDRILTVNEDWFPKNTNKISASVEDEGVVYNFYGIKNYPISIPDTMVVENFRNITCAT